ncbi:ATPase [Xylanibacillus composti]|uniref:ATPase n=1 Tax=Xylanibacillus composti TaxID=1572762 RepID=A0A8J4H786_9BACL|nr:ATPase [Xylanibacillus composti]MDT9723674.1 ATPase [Xylanibacillus composti]GIQ71011.1 hypothetical protein XYCOK13_38350 [Xylanibacillus composti]
MFRLGKRVIIVADTFEQKLPVGEYGYIIAYDRNNDNAFDYVVRIPKLNRNVYVPASDLELEEVLQKQEAERVEREALIDFALATRNEALFRYIMTGESEDKEEAKSEEVQSREEFIRQVNLKAWI